LGQTETLLTTVTNTGDTSVTVTGISSNSLQFSPSNLSLPFVLAAGQSFNLNVIFSPTTAGWTAKSIEISSSASNPSLYVQVSGTGASSVALAASPSVLTFSQIAIGASASLPVVITNARAWAVTLTAMQTYGSGFSIPAESFPLTLSSGQSVTVNVTFSPQFTGTAGGSLSVFPGLVVPITGTGSSAVGQLALSPAPLSFGDVNVGNTGTQSVTLSATGASVTVSSAASGSSQFVLQGASLPFTLAAGQSQAFNIAFTPQNSGLQSSSISFTSNASNSQAVESISGTGTTPSYSISLNWNATSDASGYNVYRSPSASGSYAKINSSLDPGTAYTDSSVVSGQTYYYEATSVNSAGAESARSSPAVEAVIP
jgi:hypothetical protein